MQLLLRYTFSAAKNNSATDTGQNTFLYPHHSFTVAEDLIKTAQTACEPQGQGYICYGQAPEGIKARLIAAHGEEGKGESYTYEQ
jgi:fructose-bisphosphate aldolase, class I